MGKLNNKRDSSNHEVDWAAWLADDPVPIDQIKPRSTTQPRTQEEIRRDRVRFAGMERPQTVHTASPTPSIPNDAKQISVNISLKKPTFPKLKQLKPSLSKLPRKKLALASGGTAILIGVALVGINLSNRSNQNTVPKPNSFTPLIPKDNPQVAGAQDTKLESAEGVEEVLSFPDVFLGKPIAVSQQKVPDELQKESDPAKKLATQLGATEYITTAYGPAYFTTDDSKPLQTIVFVYRDSLVFITSNTHRDGESWKLYIESLRP